MQDVKDLIMGMVNVPIIVITGKVKEVDEAKMLCVVEPDEEGADYNNVRLRAQDNEQDTGVIAVPKVGSSVAIARLYNDSDTFFVVLTSEVEKIVMKGEKLSFVMNLENNSGVELNFDANKVKIKISGDDIEIDTQGEVKFNGGGNGGVPVANGILSNLNELRTKLNNLVAAYNTHIHAVPGPNTLTTPSTALQADPMNDFQNNKVRH